MIYLPWNKYEWYGSSDMASLESFKGLKQTLTIIQAEKGPPPKNWKKIRVSLYGKPQSQNPINNQNMHSAHINSIKSKIGSSKNH